MRCLSRKRPIVIARARQHRERQQPDDFPPSAPARKLFQDIRAHDPDEPGVRKQADENLRGIDGIARPDGMLDSRCHHTPAVADARRPGQPIRERRHASHRFQRIAGRDQQPNLIQPQPFQRQFGNVPMAGMRRVERSAQQPDTHPPPVAKARDRIRGQLVQGRICPVPRTRYR